MLTEARGTAASVLEEARAHASAVTKESQGRAEAFECDVSDPDQVRRAVGECRLSLGPIDLLVHNAHDAPVRFAIDEPLDSESAHQVEPHETLRLTPEALTVERVEVSGRSRRATMSTSRRPRR